MMDSDEVSTQADATSTRPLAVVGIGVSAASFDALRALFEAMPARTGAAFVIVSQSEHPVSDADLIGMLAQVGAPAAVLVADGDLLESDRCHVAPDATITTFIDGRLHVSPAEQRPGHRGTVDTFLISLAEEWRDGAVAILLAGLENAGSIGLARLKECGGLSLAQSCGATGEAESPAGEIGGPAGLADEILPLAETPGRLIEHLEHLRETRAGDETADLAREGEQHLPAIASILRQRTGHDFHGYKSNTFLRRIQRRMHVTRIANVAGYVDRLRTDGDEAQHLFQDLLIGVTQFFRDPREFERLRRDIIPAALRRCASAGETFRVWVLGCATGEEAYSVAILIRESADELDHPPAVQIFATDIDARALTIARTGRYPGSIEAHIPPARLARWFVQEGGTYCVHRDLREMCIFSAHNVIRDAPFSRIDLVSCRNLLIYLRGELQDRLIPLFHFALRTGGHLFLGPSESVSRHARLFQPVDRKHRLFRRLDTGERVLPDIPLTARADGRLPLDPVPARRSNGAASLARRAERAVERFAPAYVIVGHDQEILHFSGRTGPFLEPASGAASLNLLNLVHRDLRVELRGLLHRVSVEHRTVDAGPLAIGAGENRRLVGLTVEPLDDPGSGSNVVVLFRDHAVDGAGAPPLPSGDAGLPRDELVNRLEAELRLTKDRLQAAVEELESTSEELKSSNEEYQSINEELQSANEELETSKEELQSVNEELQTVNGELAHRIGELAQTNSDLKNLLESTQIATLFLDNQLRVKSFTPSISEVFHLVETDIGRPIAHIAARVPYPTLDNDVRRVLRTLSTVERQVGSATGSQFLVRVLPYRSVDNFIAGTVLTFLDVTNTVRARAAVRATTGARIVTWESDANGVFRNVDEFENTFGVPCPPTFRDLIAIANPADREPLSSAFDNAVKDGSSFDVESRLVFRDREIWIRVSGTGFGDLTLGVFQDVDDRRRAEQQRTLLMAELQHRVKNILAVVRSVTDRTLRSSTTLDQFSERFSGRIDALARTQGLLANRGLGGVELAQIVRDEVAATIIADGGQVTIEGPPVILKDKVAEIFSLGLHELATNAAKYGALSRSSGHLSIRWRIIVDGTGRLSLEWHETGVALPGPPPASGFGRQLIERGLPYDLGASTSLAFTEDGVRCVVEVPLGPHVIELAGASRMGPDGGR